MQETRNCNSLFYRAGRGLWRVYIAITLILESASHNRGSKSSTVTANHLLIIENYLINQLICQIQGFLTALERELDWRSGVSR